MAKYKRQPVGHFILKVLQQLGGAATKQKIKEGIVDDDSIDINYDDVFVPARSKKGTLYIPFDFDFNFGLQELFICGYIESYKRVGTINLTESGRAIEYSSFPNAEDKNKIDSYWEEHRKANKKDEDDESVYDEKITEEKIESEDDPGDNWRIEILEKIKLFSPKKFESFSRRLLSCMGIEFDSKKGIQISADHGIDGYGFFRSDDFRTSKVVIQCKRYTDNPVSEPDIDKFKGVMDGYNADYGVFITTSYFSNQAKEKASQGTKTVTLIDGQELVKLIEKYELEIYPTYSIGSYYNEKD